MNVIINGNVFEGTKLYTGDNDHLFLDDQDLGELDDTEFQVRTIRGEVYLAQWKVVNGGVNV